MDGVPSALAGKIDSNMASVLGPAGYEIYQSIVRQTREARNRITTEGVNCERLLEEEQKSFRERVERLFL